MSKNYVNSGLFPNKKGSSKERLKRLDIKSRKRRKKDIQKEFSGIEQRSLTLFEDWFKTLRIKKDDKYGRVKTLLKSLVLDVFHMELAHYSVISELKAYFQSEGADIESWNTDMIEKNVDQFEELYFVYILYNGLGMGSYVDEVIQAKIFGKSKDLSGDTLTEIKKLRSTIANSSKNQQTQETLSALRQRIMGSAVNGKESKNIPRK